MRFTRSRSWCLLAASLASLAPFTGCGEKSAPPANPEPIKTGEPLTPKPKNETKDEATELLAAQPDFVLKAKELAAEVDKLRGDAFLQKYNNKVVEVTGKVEGYEYPGRGNVVKLQLDHPIMRFECREPHAMSKAMPGQTVTLRTKGNFLLGLDNWVIVKVEGEPPLTLAADDFAREYQADAKATEMKYEGRYLVLTGTVQKIDRKSFPVQVFLTSPGVEPRFACLIPPLALEVADKNGWLKEGQKVRLLGSCHAAKPQHTYCVVLPPQP